MPGTERPWHLSLVPTHSSLLLILWLTRGLHAKHLDVRLERLDIRGNARHQPAAAHLLHSTATQLGVRLVAGGRNARR